METTFADRFWWARHRARIGANRVHHVIGCAQSLVSAIERGDRKSSKYNNQFASLFKVDANWLETGNGEAPADFDAEIARSERLKMVAAGARSIPVVQFPMQDSRIFPDGGPEPEPASRVDYLQKRLVQDFMEFAGLAGGERTQAMLDTLAHVKDLVAFQGAERKK